MKLGKNLILIRKIWSLEQTDIAELIGVNPNMVSNYEGDKSFPRVPALLRYEEITGITIYELCKTDVNINRIPQKPLEKYTPSIGTTVQSETHSESILNLQQKLIEKMEHNSLLQEEIIKLKEVINKLKG